MAITEEFFLLYLWIENMFTLFSFLLGGLGLMKGRNYLLEYTTLNTNQKFIVKVPNLYQLFSLLAYVIIW